MRRCFVFISEVIALLPLVVVPIYIELSLILFDISPLSLSLKLCSVFIVTRSSLGVGTVMGRISYFQFFPEISDPQVRKSVFYTLCLSD